MSQVRFPQLRSNVIDAISMIAYARDWDYWQRQAYYKEYFPGLCIEILYDIAEVFPDPDLQVGSILYGGEVAVLHDLYIAFDKLVDDYGAEEGAKQIRDPRWPKAEQAALAALEEMLRAPLDRGD